MDNITEEQIRKIIKETLVEVLTQYNNKERYVLYEGHLDEMSQFNQDEPMEETPFPAPRFKLEINDFDHNPPHVHVFIKNAEKNRNYECTFRISDGSVLRLVSKRLEDSTIHRYVCKYFPVWLNLRTIEPPMTNKEFCIKHWEELNPDQEIKWY